MPLRIKLLPEITDGMISTVKARQKKAKKVTDFNPGSLVRSTLEAAALSDADQYVQIGKLKEMFALETATGDDLDARVADYGVGMARKQPHASAGPVVFGDNRVTQRVSAVLAGAVAIGSNSVTLVGVAAQAFPTSGALVFDRGNVARREKIAYASVEASGDDVLFHLSAQTQKDHDQGETVYLSQVGSDKIIPAGTRVRVPASEGAPEAVFTTLATATFLDGDVTSGQVNAESEGTGSALNVGDTQISEFVSAPPWPTATVTNPAPFTGGRDLETDERLRQRVRATVQSLSRGNLQALITAAEGLLFVDTDEVSYQVLSAQLVEGVSNAQATLYVESSPAETPPVALMSHEAIIFNATAGKKRGRVRQWPIVSDTLRLIRGCTDFPNVGEITDVVYDPNTGVATVTTSINPTGGETDAMVVDSAGNLFLILGTQANALELQASDALQPEEGFFCIVSPFLNQVLPTTDYSVNETTGDIELVTGLAEHEALVAATIGGIAAYSYKTGVLREVQRIINGDPDDLVNYPGVRAKGCRISVEAPRRSYVDFVVAIVAIFGVSEASLHAAVKAAIMGYVNALKIGQPLIIAEVIAAVMDVPGVSDCVVRLPLGNYTAGDDEIIRTTVNRITVQ